jgi:N-acyl-L-homoserine lactone synthetase
MESQSKEILLGGYAFRAVQSAADRVAALRLRSRVYVEEGFIDPRDFAGELFEDEFDCHATILVASEPNGQVIGTTRYVHPGPLGLPVDRLFTIHDDLPPRDRLGEFSRLAIDRTHRGGSRVVVLGLISAVAQCAKSLEASHFMAFLPLRLIEHFAAMGFVGRLPEILPPSAEVLRRRHVLRGYFGRAEVRPILYSQQATEDSARHLASSFEP